MELVMNKYFYGLREPMSAATHFLAFLLMIPTFVLLVAKGATFGSTQATIGYTVFGLSALLLYAASTIYHASTASNETNELLRRIDHMMIFVLIAGSYTPVCIVALEKSQGLTLLAVVWGVAATGILMKLFWWSAPRFISTLSYVMMGWLALFVFRPLVQAVGFSGISLLLLSGISYTVGAVIYATKKPNFNFKYFGFHEIFHVFVMVGTAFHVLFVCISL
ncbi:MAG: hemolysin III family protein [Bacillota bacterium]